jgi:hypothetical protein
MSCISIVDFRGGSVGFVRIELWAKGIANSLIRNELGQICPTKVRQLNGFEGKYVLQRLVQFDK